MGKYWVMHECEQMNLDRRVERARVHSSQLFGAVKGNFLLSGTLAEDTGLFVELIKNLACRNDCSTIILTGRMELLEKLAFQPFIKISGDRVKNYHPMYGMNKQQVCKLVRCAAEEIGNISTFHSLLPYLMAALDIVSKRYPVSLPSLEALMEWDDEYIAELAFEYGLTDGVSDSIRGNCEAGIHFRRILRHLRRTFEHIAVKDSESKYNIISNAASGNAVMALYQISQNQKLLNLYLKEELYTALMECRRIRVVLDEVSFGGGDDELLQFLLQMKRQGYVELIVWSESAEDMLFGNVQGFENMCVSSHKTIPVTERLSEKVFGKYLHGSPTVSVGTPPFFLFTVRRDQRWSRQQEERLRVRAVDLYDSGVERLAIKMQGYEYIYLVPVHCFQKEVSKSWISRYLIPFTD